MSKIKIEGNEIWRLDSEFLTPEHRLSSRMDIYSKSGTKVQVVQKSYDGYFPNVELLEMGRIYTVERTEVSQSSTRVFLKEFPEKGFNSVCFDDVKEEN